MEPATSPQTPATDAQTPAEGHGAPQPGNVNVAKRNINYPVALRVNITTKQAASLAGISRRLQAPEGVIARWGLMQILAQHDPNYKGE